MNWIPLTSINQLSDIKVASITTAQVIFKHSTRCSISTMALNRLERADSIAGVSFYYLDLLAHRDISAEIATSFNVHHESPQVILIKNGACIYDESHGGISMDELNEQVAALN